MSVSVLSMVLHDVSQSLFRIFLDNVIGVDLSNNVNVKCILYIFSLESSCSLTTCFDLSINCNDLDFLCDSLGLINVYFFLL